MKKYTVSFTHHIERNVTCEVLANTEEEAIEKARNCDWEDSDEDIAPETGILTDNYKIISEE